MARKIMLFVFLTAIQFLSYAGEIGKALTRLENTARAGYTVFSEDGSIRNPYTKIKMAFSGISAILSDDVFLKVRSIETGEFFFTKDTVLYVEDGFLRVSDEMVLERLSFDENSFRLRKETVDGKTACFIDLFCDETAGLPPFYSENQKPPEYKRTVEFELYQCGGAAIREKDNCYFQFAEKRRIYSDEMEEGCICLSNVDVMAEFDEVERNIEKRTLKIKRKLHKLKSYCLEHNNEEAGAAYRISMSAKELRRILERKGLIEGE